MTTYSQKAVFLTLLLAFFVLVCSSYAAEPWLADFEDICGKTQDAEALSKDELKSLVDRCDKVKLQIENSDHPQKKVYLFRLDKCKRLFAYILELPEKK